SPSVDSIDVATVPDGSEISAIGDSVMLASVAALQESMPGIDIDASVSRGFANGVSIAEALREEGELREYVVIGLATNGTIPQEALGRLSALAEDHKIVLVTAFGDRPWIPPSNDALHRFVEEHPGVAAIADWSSAAEHGSGLLAPDLIHPEPAGATVYATEVMGALERLHMLELGLKPHRLPDAVENDQDTDAPDQPEASQLPQDDEDGSESDTDGPGEPEGDDEPDYSGDPRAP
ncbi:MAG TPA: hypothetical protein H9830_11355, partial [Candidatus Agrococcus pullicola]|nr:hypothetical protein [Candidatus Agrococcus pullicola]